MSKHSCCSFFSYILLVCIVYEGSHFNNGKKRISHRRISSAVFFVVIGTSSSYLVMPVCDPSLGSIGTVSQIQVSAVGSLCAFREDMIHRLLGMATWALAAGCNSPLVQAAGRLSNLGPCSVECYPVLSWEVCSCWELFSWGLYGIICCGAVPCIPLFEAVTC